MTFLRLRRRAAILACLVLFAGCARETVKTADDYYAQGRFDRAAEEYRQFIKDNPKMFSVPNAYLGLAWSEFHRGNLAEAEEAVMILRSRYPENYLQPQASYLHALIRFANRDYVPCANEMREFLLRYPDDALAPEARVLLARSEAAMLRFAAAAENYRVYLEKFADGPYAPAALIGRAEALARMAQWEDADRTLDAFVTRFRRHPDRPRALVDLARYRIAYGRYTEAEPLLEEVIHGYSIPALRGEAQDLLVQCYDARVLPDEAARVLKARLEGLPVDADTQAAPLLSRLAEYNATRGDTGQARQYYRRLAARNEADTARHALSLAWLSIDAMARGQVEEALSWSEELTRRYPAHPRADDAERMIIDVFLKAGRTADGADRLETLLRKRWNSAPPAEFYRLASARMDLRQYDRALEAAAQGLDRARRAGDTRAILSGLYHGMILNGLAGNKARAVESWWRLKGMEPNYLTVEETVYWDNEEQEFYRENRVPPERRGRAYFEAGHLAIHVAGFEWKLGDIESMKLSNSLGMLLAASVESHDDMTYVPRDRVRFAGDLLSRTDFARLPDTWFPLRSNVGADWIVGGRIGADVPGTLRLSLRMLRLDYDGVFPFDYEYVIPVEESGDKAPFVVRETVERMRLYRPER